MKGLARFQNAVLDAVQSLIRPLLVDPHRYSAASDALMNHLLDLPGPRHVARDRTPREVYVSAVFDGFVEITKSLETLEDIRFLVKRFPYRNTRVTEERYLQLLAETYLSEIYVLRERLKAYIVRVERESKRGRFSTLSPRFQKGLVTRVNRPCSNKGAPMSILAASRTRTYPALEPSGCW